jgi:nucleoside-diphosphate-sugar epimerase
VSGAAGQIGGAVALALAAQTLDVVTVSRRPIRSPPGAAGRIADDDDPAARGLRSTAWPPSSWSAATD